MAGVSVQSAAVTKQIAETAEWFLYGKEMRAVSPDGTGQVLAAPPDGGFVFLHIPGGLTFSGIKVGRFELSTRSAAWRPETVDYAETPSKGRKEQR